MTGGDETPSATSQSSESTSPSIRVGILGHVGNENLGDEAIIAAVIQNVRRRWPDAEIRGFTIQPIDTEERHGIVTFPLRRGARTTRVEESSVREWVAPPVHRTDASPDASSSGGLKRLVRRIPILFPAARGALRAQQRLSEVIREIPFLLSSRKHVEGLDLMIVAGSHQLNDFVGGPWAFPYTVLKWTLLAKNAGAKVVFLSLGAGPIDTWLGRRFIRQALELTSYRSYRDVTAKRVVDSLGGTHVDEVVPDLAFGLDSPVVVKEADRDGPTIVGLNPLPFFADYYWHVSDLEKYEAFVGKLAAFADWLVERGCAVHFIPTQLKADPTVIADVRRRMATIDRPECKKLIVEPAIRDLNELRAALAAVDIMVATRYHAIVLSLALHKPVLAVAYHDKSRDIMKWLGQGSYVVEGDRFAVEELTDRICLWEKEGDSIGSSLRQQMRGFRAALQTQYDEVFGLVDPDSTPRPS